MAFKPIEILINAKDNASSVFTSLQAKVVAVGAAIAAYFGVSAFVEVVKGAANFEEGMSRVKAATGASAAEMEKLRKAAEDAGANTKFTSVEAAGALENLAKAGLNANEAVAALPAVLQLAAAGGIDLGQSSEYITKAVMGLGLAFSDAGRVADVLALGANATNTSVTGLAQALSYAAPVANTLGLSLESTVAIIGKFADAGIDASRAGTALNSILSQFANPASQFRNELAAAGITTGNFEDALRQLAAAGPLGSKAINAVGLEAGPALRALLNQGMGALDELTAKLKNAEGSAAATAKVMQDNLNGSLTGLASVWETVKNALATPVLPVLKDGVDQLAAAFKNAVADGTVTRFGEAIASAFQAGIKWVREFLGTVDFTKLVADLQGFATRTGEVFDQVGQYATNAGNIVKVTFGVMSAGFNSVLAVIYKVGEAFAFQASAIQTGLAAIMDGFAKVTFGKLSAGFKAAAAEVRLSAEATMAASDALGEKAKQAMLKAADAAALARDGYSGLAAEVSTTSAATQAWQKTVAAANVELSKGAEAAAAAGVAAQKKAQADIAAKQSADEHRTAISQLRTEYQELVAKGDLQGAAVKIQEINKALRDTGPASKDADRAAAEAAAQIEAAFGRLGVTSAADLKRQADAAQRDYATIRAAGTSTAEDIAAAFKVAAEKAIAANKGIAPSWVEAEAATRGYRIEVDAAGKASIVAADGMVKGWEGVASAARGAGRAASAAADNIERLRGLERNGEFSGTGEGGDFQSDSGKALAKQAALMAKNGQMLEAASLLRKASAEDSLAKDAQKSRDTRFVAMMESDIRQLIAKRYGDDMVDNAKAREAIQRRMELENYQKSYGSVMRSQESMNQQRNIAAELARLEGLLEEERLKSAAAKTQGAGPGATGAPAVQAPTTTYVSNITIPGIGSASLTFADQQSQASGEDLLRKLAQAKGAAI